MSSTILLCAILPADFTNDLHRIGSLSYAFPTDLLESICDSLYLKILPVYLQADSFEHQSVFVFDPSDIVSRVTVMSDEEFVMFLRKLSGLEDALLYKTQYFVSSCIFLSSQRLTDQELVNTSSSKTLFSSTFKEPQLQGQLDDWFMLSISAKLLLDFSTLSTLYLQAPFEALEIADSLSSRLEAFTPEPYR
jgi:hypothetical protein